MGMKTAFGKAADLSGMSERQLFVSAVRQQAFVEVDEQGTEAAAVTMVTTPSSGIPETPPKPFQMIVDRPFLFLIADERTETILFMGAMFEPGA
jgi:serpin B